MKHEAPQFNEIAKNIKLKTGARTTTGYAAYFNAHYIRYDDERRVITIEGQEPHSKKKGVYIGIDIPIKTALELFLIANEIEERNRDVIAAL